MKSKFLAISLAMIAALSSNVVAQTTAFNFQGRLNDGTNPANGRYDLQFKLFTAVAGGSQVGTTVDRPNLLLINGVFSTVLDFGSTAFNGLDRFIEISVRPNGSPNAHVVLGARQQILSVPYSVKATNAENAVSAVTATIAEDSNKLGGIHAGNYARLNFSNLGSLRTDGNLLTSANAGIGTVTPNTRLTLSGGPSWTSANWTASMNMQNGSALGWEANSSGQRFGIGQTNGGLHFFRTTSGFGSTLTPSEIDLVISDNGGLSQPLDRDGVVKATLVVDPMLPASQYIVHCYNGVTGSNAGNCSFTVTRSNVGSYTIAFPFSTFGRPVVATPVFFRTYMAIAHAPNALLISAWGDSGPIDTAFSLIMY